MGKIKLKDNAGNYHKLLSSEVVNSESVSVEESLGKISEKIMKIAKIKTGKNIINFKNPLYIGMYVNQINGEINTNSATNVTNFVKLEIGQSYTISSDKYCSVIFCNSNEISKNVAGTFDKVDMKSNYSISGEEAINGYTFIADSPYMIMWYPVTSTYIQAEEGEQKTEYEEYIEYIELDENIYIKGNLLLEIINSKNIDISVFEQSYIYNQRLVANNDHIGEGGASGVLAKYICADMGETLKEIKCKAIFNDNLGSVALVMGNTKYMKSSDISNGAIHIVFQPSNGTSGQCYISYFKDGDNTIIETKSFNQCDTDGITEYSFGLRLEDNVLTVYFPDGTEKQYVNEELQSVNGRYALWEQYSSGADGVKNINAVLTKLFAVGVNGAVLMDDFKRNDGAIGNAPTGQVYWQFRNGAIYEL